VTSNEPRDEGLWRLEERLRSDPSDELRYQPGRFARLVERGEIGVGKDRQRGISLRGSSSPLARGLGALVAIGAGASVVVALLAVRGGLVSPGTGDLRARVTDTGVLRIAVRPDSPQVLLPNDAYAGFDVDVAQEVARRLGLRAELVVEPFSEMLATTSEANWDVALPSASLSADRASGYRASAPYYYWPSFLIVPASPPVLNIDALNGAKICVASGGVGQPWLSGRLPPDVHQLTQPPTGATVHTRPDDAACLAEVSEGRSDAMVSTHLSAADIDIRLEFQALTGAPVVVEDRRVIARRSGPDATSLLADIERTIDAMRADGTLAQFSRNRFGGADLTAPNLSD
jgi:cystine transport system substrate-binding protein